MDRDGKPGPAWHERAIATASGCSRRVGNWPAASHAKACRSAWRPDCLAMEVMQSARRDRQSVPNSARLALHIACGAMRALRRMAAGALRAVACIRSAWTAACRSGGCDQRRLVVQRAQSTMLASSDPPMEGLPMSSQSTEESRVQDAWIKALLASTVETGVILLTVEGEIVAWW